MEILLVVMWIAIFLGSVPVWMFGISWWIYQNTPEGNRAADSTTADRPNLASARRAWILGNVATIVSLTRGIRAGGGCLACGGDWWLGWPLPWLGQYGFSGIFQLVTLPATIVFWFLVCWFVLGCIALLVRFARLPYRLAQLGCLLIPFAQLPMYVVMAQIEATRAEEARQIMAASAANNELMQTDVVDFNRVMQLGVCRVSLVASENTPGVNDIALTVAVDVAKPDRYSFKITEADKLWQDGHISSIQLEPGKQEIVLRIPGVQRGYSTDDPNDPLVPVYWKAAPTTVAVDLAAAQDINGREFTLNDVRNARIRDLVAPTTTTTCTIPGYSAADLGIKGN